MGVIDWICCLCNHIFQAHDNRCPRCGHWINPAHMHHSPITLTLFQRIKHRINRLCKRIAEGWKAYCQRVLDNFKDG